MPVSPMFIILSKCKTKQTVSGIWDDAAPDFIFKVIKEPVLIFNPVNDAPNVLSVSKAAINLWVLYSIGDISKKGNWSFQHPYIF